MAAEIFDMSKSAFSDELSKKLNGNSIYKVDYSPLPEFIGKEESINHLGMLLRDTKDKGQSSSALSGCGFIKLSKIDDRIIIISLIIENPDRPRRIIVYVSHSGGHYQLIDDFVSKLRVPADIEITDSSILYRDLQGNEIIRRDRKNR
jgi:hypothetical protein